MNRNSKLVQVPLTVGTVQATADADAQWLVFLKSDMMKKVHAYPPALVRDIAKAMIEAADLAEYKQRGATVQ